MRIKLGRYDRNSDKTSRVFDSRGRKIFVRLFVLTHKVEMKVVVVVMVVVAAVVVMTTTVAAFEFYISTPMRQSVLPIRAWREVVGVSLAELSIYLRWRRDAKVDAVGPSAARVSERREVCIALVPELCVHINGGWRKMVLYKRTAYKHAEQKMRHRRG